MSIFSFLPFLFFSSLSAKKFVKIKNIIPSIKPIAGGNQLGIPCFSASSAEGNINDHILAAIITPAANPIINFCTFRWITTKVIYYSIISMWII